MMPGTVFRCKLRFIVCAPRVSAELLEMQLGDCCDTGGRTIHSGNVYSEQEQWNSMGSASSSSSTTPTDQWPVDKGNA